MRLLFTGLLTLAAVLIVAALPRIPQDPDYHHFADQRPFFHVPNFLNVVSNAPFVLAGGLGLIFLLRQRVSNAGAVFVNRREQWPCWVFFFRSVLIGFGSVYYHLTPDNDRLVWDRLAMTIVFMSLLASIIAERISARAGLFSLLPLLILGASSVIYWGLSEQRGIGDLRLYGLVHFYPALLILLVMLLFPLKYTRGGDIFVVFAFYALATICELLDKQIFSLGQIVSGHTIKHLFAALAIYWVLRMICKRHHLLSSTIRGWYQK